jgi:hypothetical protein
MYGNTHELLRYVTLIQYVSVRDKCFNELFDSCKLSGKFENVPRKFFQSGVNRRNFSEMCHGIPGNRSVLWKSENFFQNPAAQTRVP